MKFCFVLPFLLLLVDSSKESTLSHKRRIRGLDTTLQANFNGSYQRKNPCTNVEIESSSYVASHEFHHHVNEDTWSDYSHKCSAIINNFLRGIGNLVRFNSKQNGAFNFHINTSISQKQDGHCLSSDKKKCSTLPTIIIEAESCQLPPPCECSPKEEVLSRRRTLKPIDNYSTTQFPTYTPFQDERVYKGVTEQKQLKDQKLIPVNDGPDNRNFAGPTTPSAQAENGGTKFDSQRLFNGFTQDIKPIELPATFTQSSDEFTTVYPDDRATAPRDRQNTEYVNPPVTPTQWGDFTEGATRYQNPSQTYQRTPRPTFVNDGKLITEQYQPKKPIFEDLGEEIPDVPPFGRESSPVDQYQRPLPVGFDKARDPDFTNYDEEIPSSDRFQPADASPNRVSDPDEKFPLRQETQPIDDRYESTTPYPRLSTSPSQTTEFEEYDETALRPPEEPIPNLPEIDLPEISSYPPPVNEFEEYEETVTKPPIGDFSPNEEQTAASLKTPPGSSYPDYDPEEFSKPTTPMVEYPDQFSTTPLPFPESSSDPLNAVPESADSVLPERLDTSFTRQPFPQPNSDSSQDYYEPDRDVDSQSFMASTNRYSDIPQELTTPSPSLISSQTEESEEYRMPQEPDYERSETSSGSEFYNDGSVSPSTIIPPAEYMPPPPPVFSASQRSYNYAPIQPKLQREEAPFYEQLDQTSTAPEFSDEYQTKPVPKSRQNTADFVKGQKHYPEQYPTRPVPTLYSEPLPTDDQTTSDYQNSYFSKTDRQSFTNPPMTDAPTETFSDSLTKYPTERPIFVNDSPIRPTRPLTTLPPRDSDMILPQESNFYPSVYNEPPKFIKATPKPALESFTTIPPNPESFTMYDSQYPEQPSQDEVAEPNSPALKESNNIRSNRYTEQTNTNFNPLLVPAYPNSEEYENAKTLLQLPEGSSDRQLIPEPMETPYPGSAEPERVDSAFSRQPFPQSNSDSPQDYYDPAGDLGQQPLRTSTDRNLEETTTMSPPISPQTEQLDDYKVSQEPDYEVTETPLRSEFYDERSDAPSSTIPPVEYVSAPPSSQMSSPPVFSAPQRFYNIQPKPQQDDSSFYEQLDQTSTAPEFSDEYEGPKFPAPQQPYNNPAIQSKLQKDEAPFYEQLDQTSTAPEFSDEYPTEPPPKSRQNTVVSAEEQKRYPEQYTRPLTTLYSEPMPTDDQTTPDYQNSYFSKTDRQSFTDSPKTDENFYDPPIEYPTLRKGSPIRPTPFLTTLPPRASDRVLPQETDFYTPVYDEPPKHTKSTPEPSLESFTTIPPNPEGFAMYDSQYPEQPSQDDGAEPNPAPFDDSSSDFEPLLAPSPTNFERFEPPTTPLPPYLEDSSALTNPPAFDKPISYSESSSQVYDNQNDQQFLKSSERYPEQYSSVSPPPSQRETPYFETDRDTGFQQPPVYNKREYQPDMRDTPPPQSFESSEMLESENQKSTEFPDLGNPDQQTKETSDQYFAPNSEDYPTDILPITQPPETQPLSATNKAQAQTFLTYSNADSDSVSNRPPPADSLPVWTDRSPVDEISDSSDFPEPSFNTPRQNAFDSSVSSKDVKSFSQYPLTTPPPMSDPTVDYPSAIEPTSQTQSPLDYYNEDIPDSYAQPQPEELDNADYLPTPPTYQDFTPAEEPFMGAVTTPVTQTQENIPNYSPPQPQPQPSYDNFSDIPGDNTPLLASRTFENSKTADQYPVTSFPSTQQTSFNRPPGDFITTPTPFSVTDIPPYASSGEELESEEIVTDNKRFDENTGARETLLYPDNVSPQPQPTTAVNYDEEMETTQYQTSPAPNPQPQTTLNYANQLSDDNPNGKLPEIFANQQPLPNSDDVYSVAESTSSVDDFEGPTPPSDNFSVENKMTEELNTVPPRDENQQETEEIGTTDYPTESPDLVGSYLPYTNQLRSQSVYRKSSPPPVENLSRDPSLTQSNKHPESFPLYKEPPQRRQQYPNYRQDWISRDSRPSPRERYFNPDRNMNYNRAPQRQELPRRFSRPQQAERYYEEGFPQNASYPDYTERRPPFPGHDYSEYDQVFPRERFDYDEVISQDSQKMDRRRYDRRDEQQRYYQGRRPVNYTPDREFPQQEHSNPLLHTLESQMDMPLHEPNESFLSEPNYQGDSHRWESNPPQRHQDAIKPRKPESDPTGPSNNPDGTSNGRFNYMDRRSREPFYEESMRPVSTSERF